MTTLLDATHHWVCPNCNFTDVTHEARPHSRFHACRGLLGLTAPLVPAGTRCEVRAVEREDYVGSEKALLAANGRPVMSVVTEREDGMDAIVFAPTATARAEG